MIGVSGGSETANTEDMSVRNSVRDDLAGENSIAVSSSKSPRMDDEPLQSKMMLVSDSALDDNEQSGHTAEQSGAMNPEDTLINIDNDSEVPDHTRVDIYGKVVVTDELRTEKSPLSVAAIRSSSRVTKHLHG
ncbi:hypothetical protein CHS0354_013268 [Potamilus streckersoni]|uniref:Uncharacterized protein n=1 Tax=Potamilus streckersoni TaxID=2493646 RepID=A0AAE0SMC6_9BIVA|nr:hypothetical protein CHS0354_013268 [Potamilus streckersoni]